VRTTALNETGGVFGLILPAVIAENGAVIGGGGGGGGDADDFLFFYLKKRRIYIFKIIILTNLKWVYKYFAVLLLRAESLVAELLPELVRFLSFRVDFN
jgi:hypothetical protein